MSHNLEPPFPSPDNEAAAQQELAAACDEIVSNLGAVMLAGAGACLEMHPPLADRASVYASIHDIHRVHMREVDGMATSQASTSGPSTEPKDYTYVNTGRAIYFLSRSGSLFRLS